MLNKISYLLFFTILGMFVSIPVRLLSQERFAGRIIDNSDKTPIIGGTIKNILYPLKSTITNEDGIFYIIEPSFPLQLSISYVGYKSIDTTIIEVPTSPLKLFLETEDRLLETVVIKGQKVSEKQKADPKSIESIDLLSIKESPSISFYNSLGNLKGVDLTTASLGFTIINTRGFNSTSPVRSLQLIDGVDNQAPGLNFSLGNFLGVSELDILKVDLIAGASSTLFGPNAFNGVINMETKNPFYHKGFSQSLKFGERNLFEYALRWSDVIKNKGGKDYFGYKFNFFHLRANDWVADNYDPVYNSLYDKDNPGGYNAVNIYGDEDRSSFVNKSLISRRGLRSYTRIGYKEIDLVDYNTRNTKLNLAAHFRTSPSMEHESPEIILSSNFGSGTTVYQGDNRFSLKDILFFQNKIEFRKKDKYFIRLYATNEDAGESYDPYFTALQLQRENKPDRSFQEAYIYYWDRNIEKRVLESGYPAIITDPNTGAKTVDPIAYQNWLSINKDSLFAWNNETRYYVENQLFGISDSGYYEPGTHRFDQKFNEIISTTSNNKGKKIGSKFFDKSALYHAQAENKFITSIGRLTVGGNFRYYSPNSNGTIFYDTLEIEIKTYEFGAYSGLEKKFFKDKISAELALRVDKNKNFEALVSPAASLVWNPSPNNYFRISFSSAIRNPTLSDQYLFLNVGPATLVGNLSGQDSVITLESFLAHLDTLSKPVKYFNIDPIKPEKVKTIEIGARTTLFEKIYVDAGYFYSVYNDFIGYTLGVKSKFDFGLPKDVNVYRYSANSLNEVTTQGFNIGLNYYFNNYYMIAGNYSWNKLIKTFDDDPIIPAFNTPEHKYNLSISGRDVTIKMGGRSVKNVGFNLTYKWIQGFIFEGSPQFTGFIPTYELLDGQVSFGLPRVHSILKIGATNLLNNRVFQTYGGPRIGRMAYVSFIFNWNKKQ